MKSEDNITNISFAKDSWKLGDLTYAYSFRFEKTPTFIQRTDCIENCKNPEAVYGYDNISLITAKKYNASTIVTTRCSFEELGAPLIVIADKLYTDSRSVIRYGDYLEVVLYKDGVNVWRMKMNDGKVTWKKLMGVEFPVSTGDIHTLSVKINADTLVIEADDKKMDLYVENMYPSYHLGINACEGINRFYDLKIERQEGFYE